MLAHEQRLLRYMDWGFYIIFIPVILLLTPTAKLIENNYLFLLLLMLYAAVIHIIHRSSKLVELIVNGRYLMALLTIAITIAITYVTSRVKVPILDSNPAPDVVQSIRVRTICNLYFIDICFTIMLGLVLELARQKVNRQAIETEKNRAELSLYKSQINPHFMFNTLNTLYGLYITKSDKTGEVFIKFTDIIKYMYSNTDKEHIAIRLEVKYLSEYIDLHKLRLGAHTCVNFHSELDDDSMPIPPMILITFVENCFKYGVSSTERGEINIEVTLRDRVLHFTTRNRIFTRGDGRSGIGIENCRKRLELLYGANFELHYDQVEGVYEVELKIWL